MIGNFEKKYADLNIPINVNSLGDYSAISDLFLCLPELNENHYITSPTNRWQWEWRINDNLIYPIHKILEVTDQSEQITLHESKQNFRYVSKHGKRRFQLGLNCDISFYQKLKTFEGKPLTAFLADVNGNLYGYDPYGSGALFFALDIDSLIIDTPQFGTSNSAFTNIIIDFADPSQFERLSVVKPSWAPSELRLGYNSIAMSQVFTKNDCPQGLSPTSVTYELAEGAFTSEISQEDANQKAIDDIAANGQDYANIQGACGIVNFVCAFNNWRTESGILVPDELDINYILEGFSIENTDEKLKFISTSPQAENITLLTLTSNDFETEVGVSYKIEVDVPDGSPSPSPIVSFVVGGVTFYPNGIGHSEATIVALSVMPIFVIFDASSGTPNGRYVIIDNLKVTRIQTP